MRTCILAMLMLAATTLHGQQLQKGVALFENKQYEDAKKIFSSIDESAKADFAGARYYLGRIAFIGKNYEDAADYFEEAFEANDKVADYFYWYGSAIGNIAEDANTLRQGILAPKIKFAFEKTIALDPTNVQAHWGLVEFYTKAPGFMGGDWEKARETARGIMKINKPEGLRAMGIVYEREENFMEAEKYFIQAYQADPQYVYNLSNFYTRQKNFEKAFQLFDQKVKANPDDMLALYQIGKLAAMSGKRMDEGEKSLVKYLTYQPKQNEPSIAGANMRLAQIKEKKGINGEAKRLYETALKLDPNLKEAKEGLDRLAKV